MGVTNIHYDLKTNYETIASEDQLYFLCALTTCQPALHISQDICIDHYYYQK